MKEENHSMIKKVLIASALLVLMIGVVHAEENVTDDTSDDSADDIVKESQISVKQVSGKEKSKVKIKATVTDENGNPIKNADVNFKIKGENYKAKSNKKGVATLTYKLPKAKLLKIRYKEKKNIITKTKYYQTDVKVKVTLKASDNYTSKKTTSNAISKRTVVKKYRYSKRIQTEVLPWQFGDHTYKRGKISIQIICDEEYNMDVIWIAAEKTKTGARLKIASKLYSKHNGKWKWDSQWKPMMSEHDTIIQYYDKLPKTSYIKVRCEIPSFKLIKTVEY